MMRKFTKASMFLLAIIIFISCLSSCQIIKDRMGNHQSNDQESQTEEPIEEEEPGVDPEPIDVSFREIDLTVPAGYTYDTQTYNSNSKNYVVLNDEGSIEK